MELEGTHHAVACQLTAGRADVSRFPKACAKPNSGGRPTGIESVACALLARPATVPTYWLPFLRTNPLTGRLLRGSMRSRSPTVPGPSRLRAERGSALPDVVPAYPVVKQ